MNYGFGSQTTAENANEVKTMAESTSAELTEEASKVVKNYICLPTQTSDRTNLMKNLAKPNIILHCLCLI